MPERLVCTTKRSLYKYTYFYLFMVEILCLSLPDQLVITSFIGCVSMR